MLSTSRIAVLVSLVFTLTSSPTTFLVSLVFLLFASRPGSPRLGFAPFLGQNTAQGRRIQCASVLLSQSLGRRVVLGRRHHHSSSSFVVIISSSSLSTSCYCVASSCVRWSFRRRVSPSRVGRFPRPRVVFPPSRPSSSSLSSSSSSSSVVVSSPSVRCAPGTVRSHVFCRRRRLRLRRRRRRCLGCRSSPSSTIKVHVKFHPAKHLRTWRKVD